MRRALTKHAATVITASVMSILLFGCDNEGESINPFSNITTLDCRTLIIRNVSLTENIVEVTLENTCKSCEDGWVYLGMVMTNRTSQDTLAQTECLSCFSCPRNGESEKYELTTNLTTLPDLKSIQFNFGYLCADVTYIRK